MASREDLGSWLEGTPGGRAADDASGLGLPADGPGAMASVGRRVAAVAVDWALCLAVSAGFFPSGVPGSPWLLAGHPTATLAVFGVSTAVLVALLGTTVGHRLLGLRVVRLAPRPPVTAQRRGRPVAPSTPVLPGPAGLRAGVVRTALLCLVLPAVVWDRHGRGMHDVAAGTVIVRA